LPPIHITAAKGVIVLSPSGRKGKVHWDRFICLGFKISVGAGASQNKSKNYEFNFSPTQRLKISPKATSHFRHDGENGACSWMVTLCMTPVRL
jgi:hypothetical protein